MIPQIQTMLKLQDAMNSKVHDDWRGQSYEWYRAIWIECAELMEHHGWKWWKKQSPDQAQVVLELIDIWHFGLSSLMEATDDLEALAARVSTELQGAQSGESFLQDVEAFAAKVLSAKSFNVRGFAVLMADVGLSFDDLYRNYVGKNVLNLFRQDNGYKTGHYKKLWAGREDNEHLVEVVGEVDVNSRLFKEEVYRKLEERYKTA